MNTFDDLRKLEQGWDSYGGHPPTEEAIALAEQIYNCLVFENLQIFPSPDGGVTLENNDYIVDIYFRG